MIEYRQNLPAGRLENASVLSRALKIPAIVAELLCRRGYDEPESAAAFLKPSMDALYDPFLFDGMQDAVDCIFAAMAMEEKICVYGDYDVDGIMAVTILVRYLRSQGADVIHYIPSRHTEGYGLNCAAMEKLAQKGVSLLLTVDCGVTALGEVRRARELGIEVVVTDHHQCMPELPECAAIINPALPDQSYPYRSLCGAGVAFKLVQALGGKEAALAYIDYAAIATLADIVPLTGENRVIVSEGLRRINRAECSLGVRAMLEVSGFGGRAVEAGSVSFSIAPRINAAGRTGSPETALRLFLTEDPKEAKRLAEELDGENRRRQAIEAEIAKDAMARIEAGEADVVRDNAIILVGEGWNHGVIGIVASRLVERYSKPVLLFTAEDGMCVGSGRSVRGVHLFESLKSIGDVFVRFGGHEMAAGMTLEQSRMEEFRTRYNEYLEENVPKSVFTPKAPYDMTLLPEEMTLPLAEALRAMAPFGMGNPAPVFRLENVMAKDPITMGNENRHLRFSVPRKKTPLNCVAFSMGDRMAELAGAQVELLCSLEVNDFRGERREQLMVKSARPVLPGDTDAFIRENDFKFHDAFLDTALYNRKYDSTAPQSCSDWAELFCGCMEKDPQGSVAVCLTPEGACAFLREINERGLGGRLDVLFGRAKDERAYNAVLLAPLPQALRGYRRVLLMERLEGPLCALFGQGTETFVTAGISMEPFLQQVGASREILVPVYSAMLRLASTQTSFVSREAYFDRLKKLCPAPRRLLSLGLRVFCELGFFAVQESGAFQVSARREAPKRELNESRTFAAVNGAWEAYQTFGRLQK